MSAPKTRVRPVRIHVPDPDLHTTVVRGVGQRACCSCGWRGPKRNTYADARKDSRLHRLEHTR
jgi:hypothetical protein